MPADRIEGQVQQNDEIVGLLARNPTEPYEFERKNGALLIDLTDSEHPSINGGVSDAKETARL